MEHDGDGSVDGDAMRWQVLAQGVSDELVLRTPYTTTISSFVLYSCCASRLARYDGYGAGRLCAGRATYTDVYTQYKYKPVVRRSLLATQTRTITRIMRV